MVQKMTVWQQIKRLIQVRWGTLLVLAVVLAVVGVAGQTVHSYYSAGYDWRRIVLERMDLTGADFSELDLTGANFAGAIVEDTEIEEIQNRLAICEKALDESEEDETNFMTLPANSLEWLVAYDAWVEEQGISHMWLGHHDEAWKAVINDLTARANEAFEEWEPHTWCQIHGQAFFLAEVTFEGERFFVVFAYVLNEEENAWVYGGVWAVPAKSTEPATE